ncbi:hypothetical protein [Bradyrhizobium glycinis]|uniref:hypothetical protein n=1 Tax=Bradyrhizobium glycinis TaxID=2751812 RepID=UPI0018D83EAF|nr:hypothetical protein [Bradyrhizobium glycinis]MBH5368990.1 hypothetical protein [Bradyrhizobium glycinis]
MLTRVLFGAVALWLGASCSALADPMALDFSWQGAKGCVTLFPNPEIRISNVPANAKLLLLVLMQGGRELGGQELPMPADGVVPSGSIRTFGPCKPDMYRWTALAKSANGTVVAEAHRARFFPTDEPALEKSSPAAVTGSR